MAKEIRMPKLAQTSEEVRLLRWHVKVGDSVKKGDPLCEVENDKTTMDLESFADGIVLRLLAAPESEVTAGTVIALIGEPGEETAEVTEVTPRQPTEPARATRMVRNLAQKRGIDLAAVRGTGPAGLVTRKDLEAVGAEKAPTAPPAPPVEETAIPLSDQQLQLGRLMTEGKARIPHYYLESMILCDRLLDLREKRRSRDGDKLAVDSFFIFAAASVLSRMPRINSSFRKGSLRSSSQVNIAFAASVHDELRAPVVRAADRKNLEEIDQEVKWLTAKARNNKLEREDISAATFTISNLGMYLIDSFQAIITPPQVAVLAIARIRRIMDIDNNSSFRLRPACTVWGSFDHRAVNGAQGAEFLQALKRFIEEEI
ncbi:MAG: dihydrolipoamide acetyltransferase family protein [Spirochaetia bacterium]